MIRKRIITTNKEIYHKFNMLNFFPEVVLNNVNPGQLTKIINNINKNNETLVVEKIGNRFLIKRKTPINFSIYFRKK